MRLIWIILLIPGLASAQAAWYVGMDNILFLPYEASVLWSHTDLPLECDQWFPGHLELHEGRCKPKDDIYVDPPQNFHSNSLFHGLHVGCRWDHLRVEVEYFFREHHGYEGPAPFHRSGSYLDPMDYVVYEEEDPWLHGKSKEFYFTAERVAEVWAHCGFLNVLYEAPGPAAQPGPGEC